MRSWENWQQFNKTILEAIFDTESSMNGLSNNYYSCVINFLKGIKSGPIAIIDVGCGPGVAYEALRLRLDREFSYYGVDITPMMIEIAQKRYPEADFQVGDLFKLDLFNFKYDVVLCKDVIEHLPPAEREENNYEKALKILAKITKKYLVLNFYLGLNAEPTRIGWNNYSFYENRFNQNEIFNLLKASGVEPRIVNNNIILAEKKNP